MPETERKPDSEDEDDEDEYKKINGPAKKLWDADADEVLGGDDDE